MTSILLQASLQKREGKQYGSNMVAGKKENTEALSSHPIPTSGQSWIMFDLETTSRCEYASGYYSET